MYISCLCLKWFYLWVWFWFIVEYIHLQGEEYLIVSGIERYKLMTTNQSPY